MKSLVFLTLIFSIYIVQLPSSTNPPHSGLVHKDYDFGSLYIDWAGVIDNGEGDNWPHGPHGNFYVVIHDSGRDCSYSGYMSKSHFPGPDRSKNGKYEWLDGSSRTYNNFRIFNWRSNNDYITVMVYESDSGWGRNHDLIFCYEVSRRGTINRSIFGDSKRNAHDDAIINCRNRGVTWHNHESIAPIWSRSLNRGIPKMFIQFETR